MPVAAGYKKLSECRRGEVFPVTPYIVHLQAACLGAVFWVFSRKKVSTSDRRTKSDITIVNISNITAWLDMRGSDVFSGKDEHTNCLPVP